MKHLKCALISVAKKVSEFFNINTNYARDKRIL